jgi:EmrB/QacA subfamily drug resistance transporter
LSELSWVLNAYAIVYASLLVFFGRLADRYRRDRAFLVGVAVFTAASAACAASTSVGMLVAFRIVQAAGAALLTPTSLSLVLASHEPDQRSGAVRAWTAVGGLAAAIGPVVGGLLVTISWRWVFLVNVPIGLVALAVGARRLPEVPGHPAERPDALGVVLVTAGIALLTFGLVKGADWGWRSLGVESVMGAAAVLLTLFVLHCRYGRRPLVRPELFRSRNFTGASLIAIFFSAAFGAMLLSIVLWMQGAWGWSALRAGLAIAPGPLMVPVMSFLVAGPLIRRYGAAPVIILGSLAFAVGRAWWAVSVTASPNYLSGVLGGMILGGVGTGLILPTMMGTATASLPPRSFATGSAVINMIRQTGLALGVAVLVAIVGTGTKPGGVELASFQRAWWVVAGLAFAGILPALALRERRRTLRPHQGQPSVRRLEHAGGAYRSPRLPEPSGVPAVSVSRASSGDPEGVANGGREGAGATAERARSARAAPPR